MTQEITLDRSQPLAAQPDKGHNRWHPDIPPVVEAAPGELVVMDTLDAMDGQIRPESTVASLRTVLPNAHPLTGPVHVGGAEPGDLLAVKIEEIAAQPFGWTRSRAGFGFLRELLVADHLTRWHIADGYARSADLPGVRIPGAPFMGVMGVAPDAGLHRAALARETALAAAGGVALPPQPEGAVPAHLGADALRTIPPRENGGNVDIRDLVAGTTVYLPVFQPGALFSAGDAHYAQGDGEVCGTAIEMGATLAVRFEVIKGSAANQRDLSFAWESSTPPPNLYPPGPTFNTTGICVRDDGSNAGEDVTLAARNALLHMIDHLQRRYGFSDLQAYHLCSVAVHLRLSQVVDLPNVLVTAVLPLDIFED